MVAERLVVEALPPLSDAIDRLQVVDGDAQVMMAGRLQVSLEQVQLRAPERQPLTGRPKFGVGIGSAPSRSA